MFSFSLTFTCPSWDKHVFDIQFKLYCTNKSTNVDGLMQLLEFPS